MSSFVKTLIKSALALSLICAAAFAQPKPKAAVYIMGNPEGRNVLRAAVNNINHGLGGGADFLRKARQSAAHRPSNDRPAA